METLNSHPNFQGWPTAATIRSPPYLCHSDSISLLRETFRQTSLFSLLYQSLTSKTSSLSVQLAALPMLLFIFFGNVTRLLESNSYVRCIFIDFSKAFDTVCHEILLQKLVILKFPQYVINWLGHFLTDRTQSVGPSASLQITRSIVQGSGIGTYAFLVIIADLQPSHPHILVIRSMQTI